MADASEEKPAAPAGNEDVVTHGLTVVAYAEIGAHVRYFPRTDKTKVLAHFGLEPSAWEAARAAWAALIKASTSGDGVLVDRWNTAFEGFWQRLQKEKPALEALGRGASATAATTSSSEDPAPPADAAPAEPKAVPSFLVAGGAPNKPVPSYILGGPLGAAPPADAPPIAAASAGLADVAGPPPDPAPAAAPAAPAGGLVFALPGMEASRPQSRMEGTMPEFPAAKRAAPLPFRPADPATPPPKANAAPAPAPQQVDALTLQQVAQLGAELAVFPQNHAQIWQKYRVATGEQHASLLEHWYASFRREPRLYQEWQQLKAQYVAWLTRR